MGGKGIGRASKGICYCGRKVLIWEFCLYLLLDKTPWAVVFSPEALCLHFQFAVQCTHCTIELDLQTRKIPYNDSVISSLWITEWSGMKKVNTSNGLLSLLITMLYLTVLQLDMQSSYSSVDVVYTRPLVCSITSHITEESKIVFLSCTASADPLVSH